jgi:hypothetical protein
MINSEMIELFGGPLDGASFFLNPSQVTYVRTGGNRLTLAVPTTDQLAPLIWAVYVLKDGKWRYHGRLTA